MNFASPPPPPFAPPFGVSHEEAAFFLRSFPAGVDYSLFSTIVALDKKTAVSLRV